jgi:hypothetical protein
MSHLVSRKAIQASVFLFVIVFSQVSAEPITAAERTEKLRVFSEALDEEREIYVLAPEGFDALSRWNRIPKVVVTGIRNVDRNRDYLFAGDKNFPNSGGAANFSEFLKETWVPLVENEFNGNGRRVLIGHSFGGSYTLYSLMTDPGFFDAYIAVGSSTWVSGRALFDLAPKPMAGRRCRTASPLPKSWTPIP